MPSVATPDGARRGDGRGRVVGLIGALAAGAPGKIADGWDEFKGPGRARTTPRSASTSASGNGRYQYWSSTVDAAEAEPLTGIGPGTFEFWWAREGTRTGFVRDAHSLYFESLGELGIPGLLLIVALMLVRARLRARSSAWRASAERRALLAAATAGCAAFAVAAGIDWVWELPVLPVSFLLLAAAIAATRATAPRPATAASALRARPRRRSRSRALIAVAIPLASAVLGPRQPGLVQLGAARVRRSTRRRRRRTSSRTRRPRACRRR